MRFSADPVTAVLPAAGMIGDDQPVTASTAILLCVRNELPRRIIRNLEPMLEGIHASGYGERFHLYLLSDTSDADLAVERRSAVFGIDCTLARSDRDRLPAPHREYRLQGRQCPRVLRALGQPPRIRGHARCRQLHVGGRDHPAGADHAGRSQARHPAGARRGAAVNEPVRPNLPVRHAARHALLHHRKRVVAVRLRTLLGPQRHPAARAVHEALPASGVVRERRGGAAYPQPRPDRGGADARGRLSRARAAAGRSRLGGKSADAAGVHAPRSALVPGQHAVLAVSVAAETQAGQPLSAGARDPDVHRLAGLDRLARPRHDRARDMR